MNRFTRTALSRVIPTLILCALFRFAVLELDKLDCRGAGFWQLSFVCNMKPFVLPALLLAAVAAAVIPYFTIAYRRDQVAAFATVLLLPAVVNALLRLLDYRLFDCTGDGYYTNETICVLLHHQLIFLALPTVAAVIFLLAKGWSLLFVSDSGQGAKGYPAQ